MSSLPQPDYIRNFSIANFRGIRDRLDVSFVDPKTDKAVSQIIIGDNGSGKSSVADALEFGLRGRLSRRGAGGRKRKREVRNLTTSQPPGVKIELSRQGVVRRGGGIKDSQGGVDYQQGLIVDGFHHCPIVIRRQHIEGFWDVPAEHRQEFFFDYLREDFDSLANPARIAELEQSALQVEPLFENARARYSAVAQCALGSLSDAPSSLRYVHRRNLSLLISAKRRAEAKQLDRRSKRDRAALERDEQEVEAAFGNLIEIAERRSAILGQLRVARDSPGTDLSRVTSLLRDISQSVTEDFITISTIDWIAGIELSVGTGTDFSIMVNTRRGLKIEPTQVLSEAALDLLALLILTEMQIACKGLGQNPVIVFDDVFQSVDAINRSRSLDHLSKRLKKWQILVILHDRLMQDLIANAFRRNGIPFQSRELVRESSAHPPMLRNDLSTAIERLNSSVSDSAPAQVMCAAAGVALEEMLNSLSVSLQTSVTRRRDDRYTLGDLWPGINSVIRKEVGESVASAADKVDQFLILRNLAGAHYNKWAQNVAMQEAIEFCRAIQGLHRLTFCQLCGSPLSRFRAIVGSKSFFAFSCKCDAAESSDAVQETLR